MGDSKIVEGCTAIVVPSNHPKTHQNSGKIVKIGKCLGLKQDFVDAIYWEVDQLMSFEYGEYYFFEEHRLKRIDDNIKELKTKERETTLIKDY